MIPEVNHAKDCQAVDDNKWYANRQILKEVDVHAFFLGLSEGDDIAGPNR